jgi:hypothetical protein
MTQIMNQKIQFTVTNDENGKEIVGNMEELD